jgi:hypothetical protein
MSVENGLEEVAIKSFSRIAGFQAEGIAANETSGRNQC